MSHKQKFLTLEEELQAKGYLSLVKLVDYLRICHPEVAISYPTLRKMVEANQLFAVNIGKSYRVMYDEIARYVREGNRPPPPPPPPPPVPVAPPPAPPVDSGPRQVPSTAFNPQEPSRGFMKPRSKGLPLPDGSVNPQDLLRMGRIYEGKD